MYLKSIEMQGFKSFAGKTRLEFHDGITGIVGPNGSGKSNVGDAMRWVLGEQSAKSLRGGNMQDVIFAGTQNRRPLGFASVAITLDNSDRKLNFDADEVTVTRKLFRSGESEYLMNGRSCRLRDINELFYDTGIGKEGYSIIGQGQIEKVLSGKPEDRRELFDEAAGIVKFKRRKIASLKKLSEEQSNLVRVNDILSELTRQLGPLESQAAKAEEYLKKRDTLRNLDICMFREEAGRTRKRLAEITEKKTIAQAQLSEIAEAFEKTRMEYEQVEKELEELDSEIARARDESQKAALLKKQAEGQVDVLREQIHTAETNSELYRNRMAAVEGEYDSRKAALDAQKEERDELKASLRIAASDKEKKEADVTRVKAEIDEKNEAVENSRSRTIELLNNRSSIKEKRQRYDTMLEQIDIRKAELSSRMLQLTEMRNAEKEKLEALKKDLQEVDNAAETQKAKVAGTEGRIGALKEEIDRQNKQLEIGQTAYHREASRLESLRNIAERYEGYGNSVKRIMEQKDNNPGIHGVIADLIKTQKKYETAIETALGGALQNIVTDNESTAKYLIEYLKRGHYGRATFLPLTAMKNDQSLNDQKILSETGVLGRADSLVSCDPLYKSVAARLLGRTIVVDTIDHAIAVSRRYHQSVRMVTLEGDLLSPGGSMTGGSFKYNSNLLGRKRQIEELDSSVRALKKDMQEMQASVEKNRAERNELRGRLAAETEELQKLYIRQNTVRLNAKAGQDRFDTIEADYNRLMKERAEIDRQIGDIRDMKDSIDRELVTSESEEKDLQQQIRELSGASEDLKARETKALEEQDKARLEYSNIRQQCDFAEEKISTAEAELARLAAEKTDLQNNLQSESGDISLKENEIRKMEETILVMANGITENEEKGQLFVERREALNRDHKKFFDRRDGLSSQKSEMEQELFRLQSQEEKLTEANDTSIRYLYDEYEITPDEAEKVALPEGIDTSQLKKNIAALKNEIRALGSINVNAIEEYKELKERHTFLQTQHDDLVKAAETLQSIIDELDEGMRKQFREKFEDIRVEFDKVYKQLFGGGKGTLELTEGDDILESGVVINSQPPGKKLQNMMQLSGGEKALTAIALLFAIQNLKPSPFCLLDEIEAALDDSNVDRYAQYLHKLTKNTQFIIITHRRGTMSAADRLYGITMQEKGVSALVSVDLIESQLDK